MATLLLTLSLVTGVWAEDVIITDENKAVGILEQTVVDDESVTEDIIDDDEIIPMAASSCITKFDWSISHHDNHLQDDTSKQLHGIFSQSAYNYLPKLVPSNAYQVNSSGTNYTYVYRYNNAGTQGGYAGTGEVLNRIMVVTSGASAKVITAYPY